MDFMNRGFRNGQQNTQTVDHAQPHTASTPPPSGSGKNSGKADGSNKLTKYAMYGFFVLLVLLVVGILLSLFTYQSKSESSLVDDTKYQAVFLNGGQVYFGKVSSLNSEYVKINDVYYLRVNQQVQPNANTQNPNDISLVKLGCELHGPTDLMVVNREQVIFWENLKDDGQVAKAIAEYQKQYPEGQPCDQQQQQSNNNTDTSNQDQSNGGGTTTPTTPPSTPANNNNDN